MTTPIAIPESAERTPVDTVADILRAMARDPAVAEAVRQHVLDEELRRLPAAFAQLAAKVEQHIEESSRTHTELRAGQARLETGQEELRAGQARLETGQDELRAGQARHDADIAELRTGQEELRAGQARLEAGQDELRTGQEELRAGQDELRAGQARHDANIAVLLAKTTAIDARRMMSRFCNLINLRRPRWLDDPDIYELIENADEDVLADIPANELLSCHEADLVLSAISKTDGSQQYVIIECSAGITRRDIQRIRRNADHFARVTGCVTHAAAVGRLPPPAILDSARELNVHCLEPSAKITRPT